MDRIPEIQTYPGLDHAEIENKARNITSKEIESVLKPIINLSAKKLDPNSFTCEFHETFNEKLISALLKLFINTSEAGTLHNVI